MVSILIGGIATLGAGLVGYISYYNKTPKDIHGEYKDMEASFSRDMLNFRTFTNNGNILSSLELLECDEATLSDFVYNHRIILAEILERHKYPNLHYCKNHHTVVQLMIDIGMLQEIKGKLTVVNIGNWPISSFTDEKKSRANKEYLLTALSKQSYTIDQLLGDRKNMTYEDILIELLDLQEILDVLSNMITIKLVSSADNTIWSIVKK